MSLLCRCVRRLAASRNAVLWLLRSFSDLAVLADDLGQGQFKGLLLRWMICLESKAKSDRDNAPSAANGIIKLACIVQPWGAL